MVEIGGGVRLLSQSTGYGLVIGLSIIFVVVILVAVKIQKSYLEEDSQKSEMFMVANRTVGIGLTASAVFSSWMWLNETVFSVMMCYYYGLAAPMLYGAGVAFQIAFMAVLGVMAKIRVPHAHTSLEIVRKRYGNVAHVSFTILNLINNVFGCSSMILTGSQLITGITGMHIVAATLILPFGVAIYTAIGGLKATFLTDFIHTGIALILIIVFTLKVLSNEHIGGVYGLYDKIQASEVAGDIYIDGNYAGSLLTFKSKGSMIFGFVLKFGNLALVTMDTAFWQKSFATDVTATVPGYNLASIAIYAVPWGLGTVIGLGARVLEKTPQFPTYPNPMTAQQVNEGFPMVYAITAVMGTGGAVGFMFLLFMSLTSTVSSSMIAVSSILSFDIYRTYINKNATDRQTIRVSHLTVVFFGAFITSFALALTYGGANINWWNYFAPAIICPGVFPLIFTLLWKRQTQLAAILSPFLGMATGIAVWLTAVKKLYGTINMTTSGSQLPGLYGAIASTLSPIAYSIIISYTIKPYVFDWREFLSIELVEDTNDAIQLSEQTTESPGGVDIGERKKDGTITSIVAPTTIPPEDGISSPSNDPSFEGVDVPQVESRDDDSYWDDQTLGLLHRWLNIAIAFLVFVILITWVLWPMPLWRDYIFSRSFFAGWVIVAVIWQFFAFFAVVVYPLYDGRQALATGYRGVLRSLIASSTRV